MYLHTQFSVYKIKHALSVYAKNKVDFWTSSSLNELFIHVYIVHNMYVLRFTIMKCTLCTELQIVLF